MDSKQLRQMSIANAKAAMLQMWNNKKENKMLTIKNRDKIIGQTFTDMKGQSWTVRKMIESESAYVMHLQSHTNLDYYFKLVRTLDISTDEHYLIETLKPAKANHLLIGKVAVKDMNKVLQSLLDIINNNYIK